MKVGVIGGGFVGLVQAVGMADIGHDVMLSDTNALTLATLRDGGTPFYEPGLDEAWSRFGPNIRLTRSNTAVVKECEVVFLCLPTPDSGDGSVDLSALHAVVDEIRSVADESTTVVIKSTVPPGTAADVQARLPRATVVSNPEFLREGTALGDWADGRLVIGAQQVDAHYRIVRVYGLEPEDWQGRDVFYVSWWEAELAKYAANAYLATRLTYFNEIAALCERVGASWMHVRDAVTADDRIGVHFTNAGPGYGGSCFPKDVRALRTIAAEWGSGMPLLTAVDATNDYHRLRLTSDALWFLTDPRGDAPLAVDEMKVAVFGLAFKALTSDTRESAGVAIVRHLLAAGVDRIRAHDPMAGLPVIHPRVKQEPDVVDAARGTDLLVVATEWPAYRQLGLVAKVMRRRNVVDLRRVLSVYEWRQAGFDHVWRTGDGHVV